MDGLVVLVVVEILTDVVLATCFVFGFILLLKSINWLGEKWEKRKKRD